MHALKSILLPFFISNIEQLMIQKTKLQELVRKENDERASKSMFACMCQKTSIEFLNKYHEPPEIY